MSIRFVHGADFHMDSPFDGLSAEKAALRRHEQRKMLHRLTELACRWDAQLILLAGDLLDSSRACAETAEAMCEAFASVDIPIFIAPGNHDMVSRLSPYVQKDWPENVHIFTEPHIECVPVPELGLRVWGAGYRDTVCPPLLRDFEAVKDGDTLDILLLHGEVGRPDSPYCPISTEELMRSGMDYAALGHNHSCSGLQQAGECYYAWPGCPEGRGFDECGEKGVLVGELSLEGCSLHFVPMGGRRYEKLDIPVEGSVYEALDQHLPDRTRNDIYRIRLTGECDPAPDLKVLQAELKDRFFALTLEDATRPPRDIWAHSRDNNLRGVFLRRMQMRISAEQDPQRRQELIRAVRAGLAALEGQEERF